MPEQIKNNLPEDVTLVSKHSCAGCTSGDMFPKSRQGSLDVALLRKLGMSKERMVGHSFSLLLIPSSLVSMKIQDCLITT
jgi:hypothetical protein